MSKIEYKMKPATDKRIKRSSSIFDPLIDEFLASDQDLVEVTVENRTASYMRTALVKRIGTRELDIEVSPGYGVIYLEKKK